MLLKEPGVSQIGSLINFVLLKFFFFRLLIAVNAVLPHHRCIRFLAGESELVSESGASSHGLIKHGSCLLLQHVHGREVFLGNLAAGGLFKHQEEVDVLLERHFEAKVHFPHHNAEGHLHYDNNS